MNKSINIIYCLFGNKVSINPLIVNGLYNFTIKREEIYNSHKMRCTLKNNWMNSEKLINYNLTPCSKDSHFGIINFIVKEKTVVYMNIPNKNYNLFYDIRTENSSYHLRGSTLSVFNNIEID